MGLAHVGGMTTNRLLLCLLLVGCAGDPTDQSSDGVKGTTGSTDVGGVRGAIFTTLADGTRVNANLYAAKPDVYLDGGPGGQAPSGAAELAQGDYYFQVTDPAGKVLLSTDDIVCRHIHVNAKGVIDAVVGACVHDTGIDQDHAADGAITVQLMPFDDTTNPGGEYKVWVTPVDAYGEGPARSHGFLPSLSKTDNFKVKVMTPPPPPPTAVCGNGVVEEGEQCDDGNTVDGDGCSSTCQIEACCGNGILEPGEECDDGNNTSGDGCSADCHLESPPPGAWR